jgi:hypothetical protein
LATDGDLRDRSDGLRVCTAVQKKFHRLPKETLLLLDLSKVLRIAHSALEVLLSSAKTLVAVREGKYLLFQVDKKNRDLVESLEVLARDRDYKVPIIDTTGKWHVIGRLTKAESETMNLVLQSKGITSAQLKDRLHILSVAASNRLRSLYVRGLVRREEQSVPGHGGREFVYKSLISGKL